MIGFIGLDNVGEVMCVNAMKYCGRNIMVHDEDNNQVEKLYNKGAIIAETIKEIGEMCNIVITKLSNEKDVQAVYDELLPVLHKNQILIDMSNISPQFSKTLAIRVNEKSANLIDSPVIQVEENSLDKFTIYVGGDINTFEKVKSLLSCMAQNVIHLGPNGSGIMMKQCNNVFVEQIQNIITEAIELAKQANIDISKFIASKSYGKGQDFHLDLNGMKIQNSDVNTIFSLENIYKEVQLAQELAQYLGANLTGLEFIRELYNKVVSGNICEDDITSAIEYTNK